MRYLILSFSMLAFSFSAQAGVSDWFAGKEEAPQKQVIGWAEYVKVKDTDMVMNARIDTGALLSSVHSRVIKITPGKAPGEPERITFEIFNEGKNKTLERDLVRWVQIKRKGVSGFIKRPVVHLQLCIAGKPVDGEVNLANRSRFIYPLLIGRNILKKAHFVVDSGEHHTHKPLCDGA